MKQSLGRRSASIALAATLLFQPLRLAEAATATGVMPVSATVLAACTVVAQPLVFGNYQGAQLDATTSLAVSCTNGTTFNIGLDLGSNQSGGTRRMLGTVPGQALSYSLARDAGQTLPWGSSIGSDTHQATSIGTLATVQVHGRIAAGQYPTPGAYSDTVTITLTY